MNIGVVIPIYKDYKELKASEIQSLHQCIKILHQHPIYFLCPFGLKTDGYSIEFSKNKLEPKFEYFHLEYFKNIDGYNRLLTSFYFFKKLSNLNYILIYQLDAWVFADELEYWCSKKYDYIGAPWFKGWGNPTENSEIIGVGNGGFSLRNIQMSLKISKRILLIKVLRKFWFKSKIQSIVNFEKIINLLRNKLKIGSLLNIDDILFESEFQEDIFWAIVVPSVFSDYKVAPSQESFKFSFEVNPSLLFKMNKYKLPFGCHAWEKYEPEFWKQFIDYCSVKE